MANKLISELDAKTTDASGNLLPLYQIGDSTTRKMTWAQFAAWQATYMIDNSLISAGGGDFFKNGSVAATAGFTFTYAAEDSGSQITNNASPTSSRLRLKGWDNLIGYTTNADDAIAGTYFTSDKAINFYKKVGGTVQNVARFTQTDFYRPYANNSGLMREPRVFVQSTEPTAALAAEGDIWIWG